MEKKLKEIGKTVGFGGLFLLWHVLMILLCLVVLGLIIGAFG